MKTLNIDCYLITSVILYVGPGDATTGLKTGRKSNHTLEPHTAEKSSTSTVNKQSSPFSNHAHSVGRPTE